MVLWHVKQNIRSQNFWQKPYLLIKIYSIIDVKKKQDNFYNNKYLNWFIDIKK